MSWSGEMSEDGKGKNWKLENSKSGGRHVQKHFVPLGRRIRDVYVVGVKNSRPSIIAYIVGM